jgi:tRNA (guanine37-N1)-methyltransferase
MRLPSPWTARVVTVFPGMFPGPLSLSLAGQALARGHWKLETVDMRAFAGDRHRSVDDAPFGGGPGMVMRPDVVDAAVAASTRGPLSASADGAPDIEEECGSPETQGTRVQGTRSRESTGLPLIHLTPRGRPLDQKRVRELAFGPGVILVCGRYEGIDERALEAWEPEEISLGDFVLSGGEPAAIALIDACVRLLPGVVGAAASLAEESFEQGLLEYPQYTRPRVWRGREVPAVLVSGHHERVREWQKREAERMTKARRPDLWARYMGSASGPHVTKDDIRNVSLPSSDGGLKEEKESVP